VNWAHVQHVQALCEHWVRVGAVQEYRGHGCRNRSTTEVWDGRGMVAHLCRVHVKRYVNLIARQRTERSGNPSHLHWRDLP
jgi:hypothetical protein